MVLLELGNLSNMSLSLSLSLCRTEVPPLHATAATATFSLQTFVHLMQSEYFNDKFASNGIEFFTLMISCVKFMSHLMYFEFPEAIS